MTGTWMGERSAKVVEIVAESAAAESPGDAQRLIAEYWQPLYRFCRAMIGQPSDAEDIVQETCLKLLQHVRSGGDRSNLRAWLFAVAANGCRDRARWRVRWRPWRAELDRRETAPVEESRDLAPHRAALRALAPRDRLLISLRAHGLSYREIASAAGIAEASVGRLLARAVERWKKAAAR